MLRSCIYCGKAQNRNVCDTCYKPNVNNKLYNYKWSKVSEAFLAANPLCKTCLEQGRSKLAHHTDHIIPHRNDPLLFWDVTNLQALCVTCHMEKSARERSTSG